MNEAAFQEGLIEAKKKIESLPKNQQAALLELLEETRTRQAAIQENRRKALTALDDSKLSLAYLAFDFEATIREHAQRRKNLGEDGT